VPSDGLSLDMDHEKISVMGYTTLFEGSGIHNSNSRLQITHDIYINDYFMLLFDLTPNRGASEGHISHLENGNIRIEMKFNKPLPEAITFLLYLEYDNSVRKFFAQRHERFLRWTTRRYCTLRDMNSFLDVFPSDLPPSHSVTRSCILIVNADSHTEFHTG